MTVAHTPNTEIRAGCYCRISSDPDDKREGTARQREDTADICTINGWIPAGFYVDDDCSASNGKARPEWARLLADVEAGRIDAIVVWNQDRGWRKMADLESLRPLLEPRGVLLATTNIGVIDFRNADDVFRAQVSTAMSEMEIAKMKVRMRRAARQKAEQGIPKWTRAFGYLPGPNGPVPDPATAPVVQAAYAHILAGGSLTDICRMWNDAGAFTRSGKPWTPNLVSPFLRKPRNCGLRAHNREIVGKGAWTPLVDESTWRAAQAVLKAPGRGSRKAVRRHLLTGLLVCGHCGATLGGQWTRPYGSDTTKQRINYACRGCRSLSIRAEHVEPLLYQLVSGRLAMPDAIDLLKAEIHDSVSAERIRLELQTLYAELDAIGAERGEGLLTGKQAKLATDIVAAKITKLERQQQDSERLRVFDGIPLGKPEVADAIGQLSPDRFRAVLDVLATITVAPVGKGGRAFVPERVQVQWK
jgi:DNA invertase Pin-like site-specific DNA recombinase